MFKNIINILTAPKEAFVSIKEKPTVLVPLFLVVLSLASVQWGYFNAVDPDFLVEELIAQAQAFVNVPADQLRANYENLSTNALAIQAIIAIAFIIPLIMAIYAGYLSLISKFTNDEIRYKQWFSLSCWTSIPSVFLALAGWVVILTNSDGMIGTADIQPLSLNSLIFQAQGSLGSMMDSINLIQLWSLALSALGYKYWTGKGMGISTIIVLAPYVVIYGIWSIIILL